MQRKNFSSGTHWESIVGYSRSVRYGDFVYVSGTTATDEKGNIVGIGNPYLQTVQIIKNLRIALEGLGATLKDVVRTRVYVTNIGDWEEIGKAYSEYFNHIRPAATMAEVSKLINPRIETSLNTRNTIARIHDNRIMTFYQ